MSRAIDITINERAQHLLKVVVERYIRDGQPVGSKTLAEETRLGLSSATIRNVLADLEDNGFLCSPHTSAGRIPTAKGYRLFVDNLLTIKPVDNAAIKLVKEQLQPDIGVADLVTSASSMLSELTRLAGLVMLPRRERILLRHVEFLPLADNRVLVILVLNEQEVQNRIIYTDRVYTDSELQQAANYLNNQYVGRDMQLVRKELLTSLQQDRESIDSLKQTAIDVADKAFIDVNKNTDYVMAGHGHLLELINETSMQSLQQLFEAFTQKRDILHLLDQCLNADGLQIFIGQESGYSMLDECSVVTAPYSVEDRVVGVLGVIGPTRMPYARVISIVDITAKLLTAALNFGK